MNFSHLSRFRALERLMGQHKPIFDLNYLHEKKFEFISGFLEPQQQVVISHDVDTISNFRYFSITVTVGTLCW